MKYRQFSKCHLNFWLTTQVRLGMVRDKSDWSFFLCQKHFLQLDRMNNVRYLKDSFGIDKHLQRKFWD